MKKKSSFGIITLILLAWCYVTGACTVTVRAAEPSRCPGWPPICHLGSSPTCLCADARRASCGWLCVHD
jgi:hypothetical protein